MNTYHCMHSRLTLITLCVIGFLFLCPSVIAQRAPGDVGLGVHIGQPTGVTLKVYQPSTSLDILAAWDLDDFFFLNIHAIFDTHLNDENTIHFYYGPGGYVGIRDRPRDLDDEIELGVSGNFGLDFLIQKFEIFLQVTPRVSLVKTTNFDMGGGVGFRFYF
ncbi:MAG TPA: hypothetical protein VI603_11970 [Saprospiraceae bacterium]|nr:hypothetical protein [Saprospiraceae bacterium]